MDFNDSGLGVDESYEVESLYINHVARGIQGKVRKMNDITQSTGICEDCGKPIPAKRLEAIPGATRCVKCQEIYENENR